MKLMKCVIAISRTGARYWTHSVFNVWPVW